MSDQKLEIEIVDPFQLACFFGLFVFARYEGVPLEKAKEVMVELAASVDWSEIIKIKNSEE